MVEDDSIIYKQQQFDFAKAIADKRIKNAAVESAGLALSDLADNDQDRWRKVSELDVSILQSTMADP